AGWRWLTALSVSFSLVAGIIVAGNAHAQTIAPRQTATSRNTLGQYARDLTADAEQGRFSSVNGRSEEVEHAIEILSRARKNNPVVLTDSQDIRDSIAALIARRLATGDVPESLQGKRLLKLNLDQLFRDAKTSNDLVNKINEILSDVAQSESKIILLVD